MCVKTTAELFFYHSVVFITGVVAWQRTESGKKAISSNEPPRIFYIFTLLLKITELFANISIN